MEFDECTAAGSVVNTVENAAERFRRVFEEKILRNC